MKQKTASRGEILRQYRIAAGLTQEELGKAIGACRTAVRAFEVEATRVPSPDVAERLAEVLDMPQAELAHVLGFLPAEDLEILRQTWDRHE